MSKPFVIICRGPADAESAEQALDAFQQTAAELAENLDTRAVMDGLLSMYISLALEIHGLAAVQDALCAISDVLPRILAAHEAEAE